MASQDLVSVDTLITWGGGPHPTAGSQGPPGAHRPASVSVNRENTTLGPGPAAILPRSPGLAFCVPR